MNAKKQHTHSHKSSWPSIFLCAQECARRTVRNTLHKALAEKEGKGKMSLLTSILLGFFLKNVSLFSVLLCVFKRSIVIIIKKYFFFLSRLYFLCSDIITTMLAGGWELV